MAQDAESGAGVRHCSLCGANDYTLILPDHCKCSGGDGLAGHAEGCASIQHFVAKDIRHHGGQLTAAMQRAGWSAFGVFQGKQAVQRLLCRNCIRKQDEVTEIEQFKRKCGEEAEGGKELNMYQILCT